MPFGMSGGTLSGKTYALPTKTTVRAPSTYNSYSPPINLGQRNVATTQLAPTYNSYSPPIRYTQPAATAAVQTGLANTGGRGAGLASPGGAAGVTGAGQVLGTGVPTGDVGITDDTGMGDPGTGWMAGIKPDAARMLFENPNAFARQVMQRGFGINPDNAIGALALAQPFADVMNELALIMLGGQSDYGEGSWNETGNWMGNYLANQMTPNGRYVDFGAGMNNLLNTAAEGETLSALGSTLGIDDPAGQAKAFQALASALASVSLHPMWAGSMQRELSRQGDAYTQQAATQVDMDPYNQWLQSRGFQ